MLLSSFGLAVLMLALTMMVESSEALRIAIVGSGVSGLVAAKTIAKESKNNEVTMFEGSNSIGGRVASLERGGFTLDRGFAVFIDSYPVVREILGEDGIRQLDLSIFEPGSLIYKNGKLSKVCDPLRRPGDLLSALTSPIGSFLDKLKVARLLLFSFTTSVDQIFDEKETSTLEALRNRWQFSEEFIDEFYRPFLGGIYLSELSDQSSRMFQFIFKMFAQGSATLPKFGGIAKVGEVLFESTVKEFAKSANNFEIAFDSEVTNVEKQKDGVIKVTTSSGSSSYDRVVVAVNEGSCAKLLSPESVVNEQRSVGNLYFSFRGIPPVTEPILILNGEKPTVSRPINNLCFPTTVSRGYSMDDNLSLCSVTVLKAQMDAFHNDDKGLEKSCRNHLGLIFKDIEGIRDWQCLGVFRVENAQPQQYNSTFAANKNGGRNCGYFHEVKLPEGVFVSGDFMATATLNGAFESGRNAGLAAIQKE